ncbi:bZIP transcription factor 44-like [Rutidosis leptorrhynchoides]|uniref:bZIP transcription factor 44-like n=1 Tax=Rutidosis leptorrhynchoides TaxID=125765 RepID=UPI003A9A4247
MACTSGNSSGLTQNHHSGSEDGLMDQRKRKRMESNRDSARRSRMRKQKHMYDLIGESNRIKNDNDQIRTTINVMTQRFVEIEAENSVLRAQVNVLNQRLNSLNEILSYINANVNCTTNHNNNQYQYMTGGTSGLVEFDMIDNPWNMMFVNQQPIMASAADMFGY